jgi:hypothetical protein
MVASRRAGAHSSRCRRGAAALLAWIVSDVQVWQRIFEADHVDHIPALEHAYQAGHLTVLYGLIAVGVVLQLGRPLWAAWYAAAVYTLAYSGLADLGYYVLDRRPVPATMPWLDLGHPLMLHPVTAGSAWLSSALWAVVWLATLAVGCALSRRRGTVSTSART